MMSALLAMVGVLVCAQIWWELSPAAVQMDSHSTLTSEDVMVRDIQHCYVVCPILMALSFS